MSAHPPAAPAVHGTPDPHAGHEAHDTHKPKAPFRFRLEGYDALEAFAGFCGVVLCLMFRGQMQNFDITYQVGIAICILVLLYSEVWEFRKQRGSWKEIHGLALLIVVFFLDGIEPLNPQNANVVLGILFAGFAVYNVAFEWVKESDGHDDHAHAAPPSAHP